MLAASNGANNGGAEGGRKTERPFTPGLPIDADALTPAEEAKLEPDGSLILEMGLDTSIEFRLIDGVLKASKRGNYGGVGTHYDLKNQWPKLYFEKPACYVGERREAVWDLRTNLVIPSHPQSITRVVLLKSGRNVSINGNSGSCRLNWGSQSISMHDNASSSSMYKIQIYFDTSQEPAPR